MATGQNRENPAAGPFASLKDITEKTDDLRALTNEAGNAGDDVRDDTLLGTVPLKYPRQAWIMTCQKWLQESPQRLIALRCNPADVSW
jgi:hypothetical protein